MHYWLQPGYPWWIGEHTFNGQDMAAMVPACSAWKFSSVMQTGTCSAHSTPPAQSTRSVCSPRAPSKNLSVSLAQGERVEHIKLLIQPLRQDPSAQPVLANWKSTLHAHKQLIPVQPESKSNWARTNLNFGCKTIRQWPCPSGLLQQEIARKAESEEMKTSTLSS